MVDALLEPWEPLSLDEVVRLFRGAPFRWWLAGGMALETHVGETWRDHDDIDVGVSRFELDAVADWLGTDRLEVASSGVLRLWNELRPQPDENNIWVRSSRSQAFFLDILIGDGDPHRWTYRREPTINRPWDEAILHTESGCPYLAPELQMLFKSSNPRPKDHIDAEHVIPKLSDRQQSELATWIPTNHQWQVLLH